MIVSLGFSSPKHEDIYKGFYKKMWKLFEILLKKNHKISERLVINKLLK